LLRAGAAEYPFKRATNAFIIAGRAEQPREEPAGQPPSKKQRPATEAGKDD
jgi:hypothetical protein